MPTSSRNIIIGLALFDAVLCGVLIWQSMHATSLFPLNQETSGVQREHELRGNGFAFKAAEDIVLLPSIDMICHIYSLKKCQVNNDDSYSFYALGRVKDGSVEILPIKINSSWNAATEAQQSFSYFLTPQFQKRSGYAKREVTVKSVDWGYPDPAKLPQDKIITVVEYTEEGYFGGKGDLHHMVIEAFSGYYDVSYTNDYGEKQIVEDMLKSLILFYATS